VSTTADGYRKIGLAREPHSCDDVCDIDRPQDQLRVPLDHSVERRARFVEAAILRGYDRTSVPLSQRVHRASLEKSDGG
jgi:hypothetical protein